MASGPNLVLNFLDDVGLKLTSAPKGTLTVPLKFFSEGKNLFRVAKESITIQWQSPITGRESSAIKDVAT